MRHCNQRTIATRVLVALVPVLSIAASLLVATAGHAVVITVCSAGCDSTTVQGGVDAAFSGDTIRLTDSSYTEANIVIDVSVVLEGIVGANTTIQAQGGTSFKNGGTPGRVLDVVGDSTEVLVTDLTIRHGRIDSNGGGIFSSGILTLERVLVQSNEAIGSGGGVFNQGTLVVRDSVVSGNSATSSGGGITNFSEALLIVSDSVLSSNHAVNLGGNLYSKGIASLSGCLVQGGSSFNGGGIHANGDLEFSGLLTLNEASSGAAIFQSGGTVELIRAAVYDNDASSSGGGWYVSSGAAIATDSTFFGNQALYGGAIYQSSSTPLRVRNSTLSLNSADRDGGAIFIAENRNAQISSSTIVSNNADQDDTDDGNGGGLFLEPCSGGFCSTTNAYLRNSILANNVDRTSSGSAKANDCDGDLNLQGYNLVEDAGIAVTFICRVIDDLTGAQLGVDRALGGLTQNGGTPTHPGASPPLTHFLLEGSPAVDAGNPSGCVDSNGSVLGADQRGAIRVGRCDLGAYEAFGLPQELLFGDSFSTGTTLRWSASSP